MDGAAVGQAPNEGGGKAVAILDAAERRIREAGYGGFSFRDLAAEVGIKSASVHYHFPTKAALAAAVARRYSDRFLAAVSEEAAAGGTARVQAFRAVFRRALHEDGRMCLCGVLGAEVGGLPAEVATEARCFFERCVDDLTTGEPTKSRAARQSALQIMATLEGAMLLARTLGNLGAFDEATIALSSWRKVFSLRASWAALCLQPMVLSRKLG